MDLDRAARAIEEFLRSLDLDPTRDPELARTGALVAEAFAHDLLGGYASDPRAVLVDAMPNAGGELVLVRDLAATAICPHHLLPATGVVHVAYVPGAHVAGLGALARLVECFARRLTLQETLVQRVADALVTHLGAAAAGCVADLSPTCLTVRGQRQHAARVASVATAGDAGALARVEAALLPLLAGAQRIGAGGGLP